ncbi:adenosine 3'-phospho 5'-phosphosulfate transporter 1 isoform X2 [Ctenocephalides felis]|uniref:adenosine 3'-phospho 5'-phosphosulfate transporter 1 isoform X2 n=1 Tax=Ctenocephalides felis TaxID=7515 RepID=UPI000E6E4629|nr:adenosine 3'-phospho 5'-phosphosulfate transporter 1 isoform X2 [Ctenocephalides felis]
MANNIPEIIICLLIAGCVGTVFLFSQIIHNAVGSSEISLSQIINNQPKEYSWLLRLGLNCIGYVSIFGPLYIINKYVHKTNYLDRAGSGYVSCLTRMCLSEQEKLGDTQSQTLSKADLNTKKSFLEECSLLTVCLTGLMGSYLTWGLYQEEIMTHEYINSEGKKTTFNDSQFLVFINRSLSFILALIYISIRKQPRHRAPLYKYSFCSFSNIMSAWSQYEALKYVSFPTQVLAKSCKILPVMAMGKIISRVKYENYEYITAALICIGMVFFLFGSTSDHKGNSATTMSGVILLSLYMLFDSFTSNWQGALFKKYSMSSIQMMCGVNLFSALFTLISLLQQGGFMESIMFMTQHQKFIGDCILLSISSASGQLFVYFTIATFGPVVFTIIMTLRQAIAILLSCIVYGHSITALGIFGVLLVFCAIFLRVYCNQRLKSINQKRLNLENKPKVVI